MPEWINYIALAVAPGLAICLFIFYKDSYNREPKLNLFLSFFWGAMTIIPAYYIETSFNKGFGDNIVSYAGKAFFLVAFTEEACKLAALKFYAYRQKSFDEPFDGIVYSIMVSMGFATFENIFYVLGSVKFGMGYQVALLRMFLSVPAHASFGVLMGYHVGRAKFEPSKRGWLIFLGLFWAVLFHGTFDTLLFWRQLPQIREYMPDIFLFLGAVVSFVVALRLSFRLIAKQRLLSQHTFKPAAGLILRKAYEKDIPLIGKLARQVWPQTHATFLSPGQVEYMMNRLYSAAALRQQMKEKHEFVIVYDMDQPVGFASVGLLEPGIYKLYKIYILPELQGKGAGGFVINEIVKAITRKKGHALQLNVNRNNTAKSFYEKMGFVVLREEDIDIGNGYFMNDYIMEKKIP